MKALLILTLSAVPMLPAQEPPRIEFDGKQLDAATLQLDPFGTLLLRGRLESGEIRLWLRFPEFAFPPAGEYSLAPLEGVAPLPLAADCAWPGQEQRRLADGSVSVQAFGEERAAGAVHWRGEGGEHELRFAGRPEPFRTAPPSIEGARPAPPFPPANDEPDREDLVFCVTGNGSSGLAGQRRVAASMAGLAPTGPLDFVLLIGDLFLPQPPDGVVDPLWRSRFEQVYDRAKLDVPFYVAAGPRDYQATTPALLEYGKTNQRWTFPRHGYDFKVESHGQKLHFFAIDTHGLQFEPHISAHRVAHRMFVHFAYDSDADWKIAFGHHALYSNGESHGKPEQLRLRAAIERWFQEFKLDVYFSAHDRTLELLTPKQGITHVVSGGAGGPELAGSLQWREDTLFGHSGGGFTWCRFDGEKLELSLRDADGNVLFVHHVTKDGR